MSCDPATLMADAKCLECLTGEQLAVINISLLCQAASGGGFPKPGAGNFRITETGEFRQLEATSDLRIVEGP